MTRVQTYVFIDLEPTGLPKEENNKTRITELSMVAVKRQHLLDTRAGAMPRVQHKLTLCFNPRRLVSPEATKITGLCNDLLEYEPEFNAQVYTMIDTFLSVLSQPVCLIAQNGLNFDFPILQNHLVKLKMNFTANVLCADCYHCFYHILEKRKLEEQKIYSKVQLEDNRKPEDSQPNNTVVTSSPSSKEQTNVDEIDFDTSNISMQAINETTPKAKKSIKSPKRIGKACKKLFPWGDEPKPLVSYRLKHIYERVLNKPAIDAHRAENDCIFALEVSTALSEQFVEWVDKNHVKFSDIEPMTVGVPMQ